MRRALHRGLLGAALTVFTVAVTLGPILVVPAVLPGFDGPGGGFAMVLTAVGTLGTLVALVASVWVGHREQRRHGARDRYRRFAAALGGGGAAVVVLAVLALATAGTLTPVSLVPVGTTVLSVFVAVPVVVVVGALAGVTLASLSTAWRRTDRSFGRPLVVPVGGALVADGSLAADSVTRLAVSLTPAVGLPQWLPGFGTVGTTTSVYSSLDSVASGVVLVGGALALGAYAARRHGFADSVRRFAVLVTVGGVVGVTVVPPAVTAAVTGPSFPAFFGSNGGLAFGVASLAGAVVDAALVGTLAALAGLGITTFEAGNDGSTPASPGVGESPGDDPAAVDRDEHSEFSPAEGAAR